MKARPSRLLPVLSLAALVVGLVPVTIAAAPALPADPAAPATQASPAGPAGTGTQSNACTGGPLLYSCMLVTSSVPVYSGPVLTQTQQQPVTNASSLYFSEEAECRGAEYQFASSQGAPAMKSDWWAMAWLPSTPAAGAAGAAVTAGSDLQRVFVQVAYISGAVTADAKGLPHATTADLALWQKDPRAQCGAAGTSATGPQTGAAPAPSASASPPPTPTPATAAQTS